MPGQPGPDGDDDERQAEHDVRDQDRPEAELTARSPAPTNSASSDEPITISGAAIGRKITRLAAERPRNRCRTSANAARVPRIVAHEGREQPDLDAAHERLAHARVLARVQPVVQREPVEAGRSAGSTGSLKLIRTTTKIGMNV